MNEIDREAIIDLIRKHDPEAADEIDESTSGDDPPYKVVWYDRRDGGRSNRGMTAPAQNTIGIRNKGATVNSAASTLFHEWLHVQEVEGKDGTPATPDSEADPCRHKEVFEEQLELLCALADCAANDPDSEVTWDEDDCAAAEKVCDSWLQLAIECELGPLQVSEFPTYFPPGYEPPLDEKPCTPEGC